MRAAEALWRPGWNLALFGAAALWILAFGNPAETLERRLFDAILRARGTLGWTPPADPRIVILGLDDADLATMASLDDEYRAAGRAINEAAELGTSAVVLDSIYLRGTEGVAEPVLKATRDGAPVVFAEAMRALPGDSDKAARLRSFPFRSERPAPSGLINVTADADGAYRAYSLLHWNGAGFEPSLALSAWFVMRGLRWESDVSQPEPGVIRWPEIAADNVRIEQRELRHRRQGTRLLNFRGSWAEGAGFGHLSLHGLHELHGKHVTEGGRPLAGKILFFAYVATGVADMGATTFGANEPLVLLHATSLNDLFQNSFFFRAPRWADALGILLVFGLSVALTFAPGKAGLAALWIAGLLGLFGGSLLLLFEARVLAGTIAVASVWTVAVVMEVARRHTNELVQRQRLRFTMGLYFSPRVLKDVLENPGRLEPKRVEITVLLTDLRNSTALAEQLGTEGMLELLNRIFTVENAAVFAEDGSLEKPVGDQFLAYWGAPDPQPDSADRALRAALAVITGLESLRETLEPRTRELFGYGVAIHAGQSLIANIGSSQFFHYGVIGDLINATARVESLTKYYGVLLLATGDSYQRLSQPPLSRLIDRVVVKGKSRALDLIEIKSQANGEDFGEIARNYARAFALYQEGKFDQAGELFHRCAAVDGPSKALAQRCDLFATNPPPEWNGIFEFANK